MRANRATPESGPVEIIKEGSVSIPIHTTTNRIYRPNPKTGEKELRAEHPQFTLAYYMDTGQPDAGLLPQWPRENPPARATTGRLINQFRYELWAQALHPESFAGSTPQPTPDTKPEELQPTSPARPSMR